MRTGGVDGRLGLLAGAACYEASAAEPAKRPAPDLSGCIYQAAAGSGKSPLLKVLLSSVCENDCAYCAIRASGKAHRASLLPDELARSFDEMQRRRLVSGLFLSSGLCGNPVRTMDRLIDTVEIVRRRYRFRGYVHLKILPGALDDQIERAGLIADRVSINLESPNRERLSRIAPDKDFDRLLSVLDKVRRLTAGSESYAPAGPTTQFVAGAASESDSELLRSANALYRGYGLRRVYYSGFRPIVGTPLEDVPAMPARREATLYQADALLRQYGFAAEELVFDEGGGLPEGQDPKLAWAIHHPEAFPVEVNTADRRTLLKVPGIGPTGAERLLRVRRRQRVRDLGQLAGLGVVTRRCAPFVLLDGRRPDMQLPLPL